MYQRREKGFLASIRIEVLLLCLFHTNRTIPEYTLETRSEIEPELDRNEHTLQNALSGFLEFSDVGPHHCGACEMEMLRPSDIAFVGHPTAETPWASAPPRLVFFGLRSAKRPQTGHYRQAHL